MNSSLTGLFSINNVILIIILNPITNMEKYKIVKKLGEGAFGIVVKCINQQTQELVAIKKMKGQYAQWDECLNMPEV